MPEGGRKLFPALRLVVLAALAGALAGLVGVYMRGGLSGNAGAVPVATVASADPAADAACATKAERAKRLGEAATGQIAAVLPADPPVSFKSLRVTDGTGRSITLGERAGKTVLLNLWATWCAPCRAEMPALDALQKAKGSDRFEVMAVNLDTGADDKPQRFFAETGVKNLAAYRDGTLKVFNDLKRQGLVLGLPATFLIDADGCALTRLNGPAEWASPDAARLVDAALGG